MEGPHRDRKANVCIQGNKEEYIELLLNTSTVSWLQ